MALSIKDAERRLDGMIIEIPAGTYLGSKRNPETGQAEEIRLHMPAYVELSISLESICKKAVRNRSHRAKSGPIVAKKVTGVVRR